MLLKQLPRLLSATDAAHFLRLDVDTVRRATFDGSLPTAIVGGEPHV